MPTSQNPLRMNVGFIINLPVGDSRDFHLNIPNFQLDPDIIIGGLSGSVRFSRTAQGLLAQSKMQATLQTECVRCLTGVRHSLNMEFTELFYFARESEGDTDLILPEDAHIDLTPLVREYMLLDIPISPSCKPDCKGLCQICGNNLNTASCYHEAETIDPRLAILATLKEKK